MSAPLSPAARTRTRTSPDPGTGSGCSATTTSPSRMVAARMAAESRPAVAPGYAPRMALPVDAWKLEDISPRAYQHPADRAATAALQKVPYLDEVVRKLVALGYERALRAAALGSSVRLGQEQLPHIWVLHRQCFNALDLEDVPDLYMTQYPFANAA